jgi:DNA-binding NarL/FixJ family response regulator
MSERIKVLVVDDQGVIRAGLRMIVDHEADLDVVGEAADGLAAIDLVGQVKPDVVLMDIRMPQLDGIEATRRITSQPTHPAVLVLTTFDDEEYVLGAVRAGAAGFLLKDSGPDVLVSAVRTLAGGDSLVDPAVTRTLIERCLELEAAPVVPNQKLIWAGELQKLSDRERQIFVGLARGRSNRDLAAELVVSETTVKSHVSAVLAKLGLRSRVQAVVLAYEAGVVTPGSLTPEDVRANEA